jgi:hypothetical protein
MQPTEFELIFNHRTARLTLPLAMLIAPTR